MPILSHRNRQDQNNKRLRPLRGHSALGRTFIVHVHESRMPKSEVLAVGQLQFKQHSYKWRDAFAQVDRHAQQYESENLRKVQQPRHGMENGVKTLTLLDPDPETSDVISTFVHNGCQQNIDRFLYRQLLPRFLARGTMHELKQHVSSPNSRYALCCETRFRRR
jgi:hypothetical protein